MRYLAMSLAMALAVSGEGAGQIEIEVSEITPAIGDTIVEKVQFVQVEGEVEGTDLEGQFALLGIDISTTQDRRPGTSPLAHRRSKGQER